MAYQKQENSGFFDGTLLQGFLITLLDPYLKQFDVIWAAAGAPNSVFELTHQDLDDLTQGRWVEISQ